MELKTGIDNEPVAIGALELSVPLLRSLVFEKGVDVDGPPKASELLAPPVPVGPPEAAPLATPPVPNELVTTETGLVGEELGPPDATPPEPPLIPVGPPDAAYPVLYAVPNELIITVADVEGATPEATPPAEPPNPPELTMTVSVENTEVDVIGAPLAGAPAPPPLAPPLATPLGPPAPLPFSALPVA